MKYKRFSLDILGKYNTLFQALKKYERVAVAFSGGVDSTLLCYAAGEAVGKSNIFVYRAVSELVTQREQQTALAVLDELEIPKENITEILLRPLTWPEFISNTQDRCYYCKKQMYKTFLREGVKRQCVVLLDGSNVDDLKSVRPGFRAIHELGIQTPLLDAGLHKKEIRSLARGFHLSNHNKPSNSCLATRIPEATVIEEKDLQQIEKCEEFLLDRGFSGCRVRLEGEDAVLRLTTQDSEKAVSKQFRAELLGFMQHSGFKRILFDLTPLA